MEHDVHHRGLVQMDAYPPPLSVVVREEEEAAFEVTLEETTWRAMEECVRTEMAMWSGL